MSKNMNKKSDVGRVPYGLAVHDEEEEKAVLEVIRNHETIKGVRVKEFEKKVASLFGKKFGVMTSDFFGRFKSAKAKRFEEEPELTITPNFFPNKDATFFSNSFTLTPLMVS
jgi:hypothetical protein